MEGTLQSWNEEVEDTVEQGGRGGRYSKEEEVEGRAGRKRWKLQQSREEEVEVTVEQGGRGGR